MKRFFEKVKQFSSNKWVLLVIDLIAGRFGVHRFLMGRWVSGILMLLGNVFGISGVWATVDAVLIVMGKLKPKEKASKVKEKNKTKAYARAYKEGSNEIEEFEGVVI